MHGLVFLQVPHKIQDGQKCQILLLFVVKLACSSVITQYICRFKCKRLRKSEFWSQVFIFCRIYGI